MSETTIKKLSVVRSVTGPGIVDVMQNFHCLLNGGELAERHRITFIGYPSDLSPDSHELVCVLPSREEHYAALIVTALNAHSALLEACKEFVRKCECGEARSVRSYAQMKAAIALAEGGETA